MDPVTTVSLIVVGVIALVAFFMAFFVNSVTRGEVTQLTSATTAVTLNKEAGAITTVALTTAADTDFTFTVNNSTVKAESVVIVSLSYNGTTGYPVAITKDIAAGTFKVVVRNVSASAPLDAAVTIHYRVI